MQLRTRQIAKLVLLLLSSLCIQYPANAQPQSYGFSRYPKILSAVEDSSGNFLLLNLQGKASLSAPSISYLPGNDGQTIMVADFYGLIWAQDSRLIRPANDDIESIRLGQFQLNPPIFRISIATSNLASLKRLEFSAHAKSLVIKFPLKQEPAISNASKLPPLAPTAVKQNQAPLSNASGLKATASLALLPKNQASSTAKVPFRSGGLYLALGSKSDPIPAMAPDKVDTAITPASKQLPLTALDRTSSQKANVLPALAPELPKAPSETINAENLAAENRKPASGLAGKLKRLFHRNEALDASPAIVLSKEANEPQLAETTKSTEPILSSASNPQLEFSGKDPYKVRFKFDSKIKYKSFKLDDPPRYVLDIEGLEPRSAPVLEPDKNAWLKDVRIAAFENNTTRIVLDLAQSHVQIKEENDLDKQILTLTLGTSTAASLLTPSSSSLQGREVVLDAGHGGSDPGAQRGDIQEKEITLAITQKLKRYLEDRGVKVIMTRSDDTFVSLEDRVKITNSNSPDAFVSIHINSLETDGDIKGIETYYHNDKSLSLAGKVHEKLLEKLLVPDRSVRKARFYVVNHTERPAILAEVGFISNKEEREKLISSDYQAKVAESVGQGVILYLTNASELATATVSAQEPELSKPRLSESAKANLSLASKGQSAVKQKIVEHNNSDKALSKAASRQIPQ